MSRRFASTEFSSSAAMQDRQVWGSTLSDYWVLTKPEVNLLILITTFVGFYLASANKGQPFSFAGLCNTLLGTLLVASGIGTLNQYVKRAFDAQMRRTARRPAAAGRLKPSAVLAFGIALAASGSVYLALAVNLFASMLAMLTLLIYLFVYTPLKRKTPLCILVGAFPGAMPPLIGYAAACGRLNVELSHGLARTGGRRRCPTSLLRSNAAGKHSTSRSPTRLSRGVASHSSAPLPTSRM